MNQAPRSLALVTGASRGIGLSIAQRLANEGHDLVIIADDHARIEAAAKELRNTEPHPDVRVIGIDLTQRGAVDQIVRVLKERRLEVDVLCCNAGVGAQGDFARETDLQAELAMIQVNIVSMIELTKHVVKGMVARDRGRIVFTASFGGLAPTPSLSVYGATRAFVFAFAESLREELRDTQISVTALCPGPNDTSFFARPGALDARPFDAKPAQGPSDKAMNDDQDQVVALRERARTQPTLHTKGKTD